MATPLNLVITGAAGQLGQALLAVADSDTVRAHLAAAGRPLGSVVGLRREDLDLTDAAAVARHPALVGADESTVVIHAAAYTAVDKAEEDPDAAFAVNAAAVGNLGAALAGTGALVVGVSTDYVFGMHPAVDGEGRPRPWRVDDECDPAGVYGRSKLAGEHALKASGVRYVVARTAWVFSGDAVPEARDFVGVMAGRARAAQPSQVVADQVGSPTFVGDLAAALIAVAARDVEGTIHVAGSGQASWCEVARAVYEDCDADPALVSPISSAQWRAAAPRPPYSVLDGASLRAAGVGQLPHWRGAVTRAVRGQLVPPDDVIAALFAPGRLH